MALLLLEAKLGSELAGGVTVGLPGLRGRGKGGWRGKGSDRGEMSRKTDLLQRADLLAAREASWESISPCTVRVLPRTHRGWAAPSPRQRWGAG